ncbi:VanZ family protein [Lysinibacillus sphaericus]|uniref:VanZ family protein n=1 Tax=Lysinibacillus sphaericus TaxID=1421 RepID=UPI001CBE775D|nr:VanZ family protein [Lysinibacillus sphaericus]
MKKSLEIIYWFILLFYIFLLIDTVFISRENIRSVNLIPFDTIKLFIAVDNRFGNGLVVNVNIWGNVLMFVPAGIYVILHNKNKSILINLFLIFLISLGIEIIQYIFSIGATDIDDIILNVVGGSIGLLIYNLLKKIFKNDEKNRIAISILSLIVGFPVLIAVIGFNLPYLGSIGFK